MTAAKRRRCDRCEASLGSPSSLPVDSQRHTLPRVHLRTLQHGHHAPAAPAGPQAPPCGSRRCGQPRRSRAAISRRRKLGSEEAAAAQARRRRGRRRCARAGKEASGPASARAQQFVAARPATTTTETHRCARGAGGRGTRAGAGASSSTRGPRAAATPAVVAVLAPKGRAREVIPVLAPEGSAAAAISPSDQEAPLHAQTASTAAGDREEGHGHGAARRRY